MQPVRKPKNAKATIGRILNYMKQYRLAVALVVMLVLVSSATSIAGTYFLKPLINNYIVPFIGQKNPDLSGLIQGVTAMAVVYAIGALSAYT
ncbi:MAG: ABC transporter ATP-binding protein, partial [Clostridia bacterium]|nr:ABC transporter ATP-binding protein [Clostridia bacterium]